MVYTPSTLHRDTPLREVAMPWLETDAMHERLKFVQDALSDRFTMAEVCARYGVSRPIGYTWIALYAEEGRRGLGDRSRAPHTCPHTRSATRTDLLSPPVKRIPSGARTHAARGVAGEASTHPRVAGAEYGPDLLARCGLVQRRRTRTHASHAEAASDQARAPDVCGPAAQLRCVPARVHRRAVA